MRHSILFLKHAAHEDVSSRLEVRSSHTLTNQVLRLTNAALRIDENEAVTETSVGEYRQRGPRKSAISRHKVRRGIEFAHVIRVVLSHRPMSILRAIARIRDKPDSVSLDGSIGQWTGQLVVAAGECKFDVTQGSTRFQNCRFSSANDRSQTAFFAAFTGRTRTIFRAGLALKIVGSLVNGLMPCRSFIAGFLMTTNFANPGTKNVPVFLSSL